MKRCTAGRAALGWLLAGLGLVVVLCAAGAVLLWMALPRSSPEQPGASDAQVRTIGTMRALASEASTLETALDDAAQALERGDVVAWGVPPGEDVMSLLGSGRRLVPDGPVRVRTDDGLRLGLRAYAVLDGDATRVGRVGRVEIVVRKSADGKVRPRSLVVVRDE